MEPKLKPKPHPDQGVQGPFRRHLSQIIILSVARSNVNFGALETLLEWEPFTFEHVIASSGQSDLFVSFHCVDCGQGH